MIDMDRRYGRWPLRVWGLIVNLLGNGLAIYGVLGWIQDGSRLPHLIFGAGLTIICILLLAQPSKTDS